MSEEEKLQTVDDVVSEINSMTEDEIEQELKRSQYREAACIRRRTVDEAHIFKCQCCGVEIDTSHIFCDIHNTPINRQIFEFFSELPFKPRGTKLYDMFAWYLAAKFNMTDLRRLILKSATGIGKSYIMDMMAFLELTHFPSSFTVIGSISERVSKQHIERLRYWISLTMFDRYITGTRDATASKTEIKLAKINSKVMALPQAESTVTGFHPCFPSSIELLTKNGWKFVTDLAINDIVLTFDKDSNDMQWEPIIAYGRYRHNGNLITFSNKHRKFEFSVTPPHRIIWKHDTTQKWKVDVAENFLTKKSLIIPAVGNSVVNGEKLEYFDLPSYNSFLSRRIRIEVFLKFLGYFTSEGWLHGSQISICQALESPFFGNIRLALNELWNQEITYNKKKITFTKGDTQLASWLEKNCGSTSHEKRVPLFIFKLTPELIRIFLNAYFEGDSEKQRIRATTVSKQLADDVQALMIIVGINSSVYQNNRKDWLVAEVQSKNIHILETPLLETFDDYVYAIQVPSTYLICRNNGKVFITGNSLLLIDEVGRMREQAYLRCYSDDTELLTENGWITMSEFCNKRLHLKVATMNPKTEKVEYHYPIDYFIFDYNGKMFHQTSRDIDLLVTPNHECYVSNTWKQPKWKLIQAKNLPKHYRIFKKFDWEGIEQEYFTLPSCVMNGTSNGQLAVEKKIPMDDWLAFFGIWIAEGSAWTPKRNGRISEYRVQVSQMKLEQRLKIKALIEKIGYRCQDLGNGDLCISNKQLYTYLKQFGKSHDKFIPRELMYLSKRQLKILFDWLVMGDGHYKSKNNGYYCTSSKQLSKDVYEIIMKLGFAVSQTKFYGQNGCTYVNFRINTPAYHELNGQKDNREWLDYNKTVYDIQIPNRYFYVRRNGKWNIGTNSYFQMGRTTKAIEISACFDSDTELLTKNGFKNVQSINEGDEVATMNIATENLEYQSVKNKFVYQFDGNLISVNGRSINQLITPNHKLLIKKRNTAGNKKAEYYRLINVAEVLNMPYSYMSIPRITNPIEGIEEKYMNFPEFAWHNNGRNYHLQERKVPMDLWLKFLGYYLSGGWLERGRRVGIAQKYFKEEMFSTCREIATIFNRNGNEDDKQFRIQNPQLTNALPSPKSIPEYVFKLSLRQRTMFLEALNLGDGDKNERKIGRYAIYLNGLAEQKLINDVQRLFITMGISTGIFSRSKSRFRVTGNKLKFTSFDRRNKLFSYQYYNGNVFGFEVPNHTLLVRRHGVVSISGNSTPFGESRAMYGIWESTDVKKVALGIEECWWVDSKIIEQAKKDLPIGEFTQLFLGEFGRVTNKVIPDDVLLQALEKGEHLPISKNLVMGIDFGETIDPTGIVILDMETGDVKFTMTMKEDIRLQLPQIRDLYNKFRPFRVIADNSNKGSSIMKLGLPDLPIEGVSMHNEKLKGLVIDRLRLGFFNNKINIADTREFPELVSQLKSYVYLDQEHKSYGPLSGHDDLVDALALAMRGMDVSTIEDTYSDSWRITRAARKSFYHDAEISDSPWSVSII